MFLVGAILPAPLVWWVTGRSWTGIFLLPLLGMLVSITPGREEQLIGAGMLVSGVVAWIAGIGWRGRHRLRAFANRLRRRRARLPVARVVIRDATK